MKRVFLYAYDKVNLGDDLFIRTITDRYPKTNFYFWSDAINQKNFSKINNLIIVDQKSRWMRLIGKIRASFPVRYRAWLESRCDAIVYIGGSIFMEYPHWERYVTWWETKAAQNRMFVLGANWGPCFTSGYKTGMANAFGYMQDICFRDHYSQEQFINIKNVRYAPDILLATPMPKCDVKNKQVFVSLIDCGSDDHTYLKQYKEVYLRSMSVLLKQYLADGWNVVLSSFCKHEGDEVAISEVISNIGPTENVSVLSYDGTNSDDILKAISASDYVIATRFHGVILALAAGRPVLPIIYSDKTLHALESIGFSGRTFDLRSLQQIPYEQSKENWTGPKNIQLDAIEVEALKHFSALDSILR